MQYCVIISLRPRQLYDYPKASKVNLDNSYPYAYLNDIL